MLSVFNYILDNAAASGLGFAVGSVVGYTYRHTQEFLQEKREHDYSTKG